ncbi:MAG: T9SS type A sorting domain-containing protein [Chitinophagales bacterium]|nr:T9SS type A sorting domain-containing protein [Chitinophagales bacterium]
MIRKLTPVYMLFLLGLWMTTTSNSNNPPNGRTGAPGDGLCSNCHSGGAALDGSVSLTGLPAVAMPNTTYTITVTVSNPNGQAQRGGFQWVALNSSNQNVGTISGAGASSTITPSGGRVYHEHNPAQNFGAATTVSYTANWTAPSAPTTTETLTFYGASVIANGNGNTSGDLVVTTQATTQMMGSGVPLSGSIVNEEPVSCNGGNNGQATALGDGGNPPYSYLWSSGSTQQTATNLPAGNASVTITDTDFNSVVAQTFIDEPDAITVDLALINGIDCDNDQGSATAIVSGGTGGYDYNWSSGESGVTANNLVGGVNFITITDANSCIETASINVPEDTTEPSVDAGLDVTITCNTPSIVLMGTVTDCANCDYAWSTTNGNIVQGGNTLTPEVNAAGTYTLTATNPNNGCSSTDAVTVSDDSLLPIVDAGADDTLNCNITELILSGNVSTCTDCIYEWNTTDGQIVSGADGLTPTVNSSGTYVLMATNGMSGCSSTDTVLISGVLLPIVDAGADDTLNCNIIEVTLSGSASNCADCTYEWSTADGQIVSGMDSLSSLVNSGGTYVLMATDTISGCVATDTVLINEDTVMPVVDAGTDGTLNCSITELTLSGNVNDCPDCTYEWSTADGQIVSGADSLSPLVNSSGTYILLATDTINGCASTDTVLVNEDTVLPIVDAGADDTLNCNIVELTLSGNVSDCADCTYEWSTTNGQIVSGADGLTLVVNSSGTYVLTATNTTNTCSSSDEIIITETPPPAATITEVISLDCHGEDNGSATISVTDGMAPYTYAWSSGGTEMTETGLAAGNYTVTVTDADNCTDVASFSITEPDLLIANATASGESGANANDGTAMAGPTGGTPPYSYLWSNNETTAMISGLMPGTYTVTVTDANDCIAIESVIVSSFDCSDLTATITSTNLSCFESADGTATVNLENAIPPLVINWSNGDSEASISGLSAGLYSVTVTDSNNCSVTASTNITQPDILESNVELTAVSCFGGDDGTASISVSGGTPPYMEQWPNDENGTDLAAGNYIVTITDANNCSHEVDITITQPDAIEIMGSTQNVSCFEGMDGAIDLTITGGTGPYTSVWSHDGEPDSLSSGNYTVTVTDANDCTATASFDISQPTPFQIDINVQHVSCFGASDGAIDVQVSGGTPPYEVFWIGGSSDTMLPAGTYAVLIMDANGCSMIVDDIVVEQPDEIVVSETIENVSCFGVSDGSASFEISGGVPPYDIEWPNGEDGLNLSAGTYAVTITGADGCNTISDISILEPDSLTLNVVEMIPLSCYDEDGFVSVEAMGGTPDYTYTWSDGTMGPENDAPTNTPSVTVTDANGCTASIAIEIPQNFETPSFTFIDGDEYELNCGDSTLLVSIDISGCDSCDVNWSGSMGQAIGQISIDSAFISEAGIYEVSITNLLSGCTSIDSFFVSIAPPLEILELETTDVSCAGGSDGTIDISLINAVPPLTYIWAPAGTDPDQGLAAGTYELTIVDAVNCEVSTSFVIGEPDSLLIQIDEVVMPGSGANDGSIAITISGGTEDYLIEWQLDGAFYSNEEDLSNLGAGTYTIIVTDANGCVSTEEVILDEVTSVSDLAAQLAVSIYPNPVTDLLVIADKGKFQQAVNLSLYNGVGAQIYSQLWEPTVSREERIDMSMLPAGVYWLKLSHETANKTYRIMKL